MEDTTRNSNSENSYLQHFKIKHPRLVEVMQDQKFSPAVLVRDTLQPSSGTIQPGSRTPFVNTSVMRKPQKPSVGLELKQNNLLLRRTRK